MNKKWTLKARPEASDMDRLQKELTISPLLCSLLLQRGVNNIDQAKTFFRPNTAMIHDPFEMKGMSIAVERLNQAIFDNEKILIYGDYDVDGTTSVSLMYNFLRDHSTNLFTYIPDRYTEGYGISNKGIDWAIEHNISLMISLDCGIRAVEKVKRASDNYIDFIICDHHLPGDTLPPALAILDPKQNNCSYPFDELSGCGVGFKLLQAFCIQNGIDENLLYKWVDLVAVSIASDIVPIVGENRALAHIGLKKINTDPIPGLDALIKKAGLQKPLSISNVVFGLGPRINAAGRIGHAKTALDLLTQTDSDSAMIFAEKLNLENDERRHVDERITEEALNMIIEKKQQENYTTVLYKKDWHKGIIGIVASRCIERYYKPTVILTESNGVLAGSVRSVNGFDVYQAIDTCKDHLIQYGGHKYAAGLTMKKSELTSFASAFETAVKNQITEDHLIPCIEIDTEVKLEDIDYKMYNILKQMGPFGPGNMQPVFMLRSIEIYGNARLLKEKHLKFTLKSASGNSIDAIGFGFGSKIDDTNGPFDMVFSIEENHFRGESSLQLMIKDIRV